MGLPAGTGHAEIRFSVDSFLLSEPGTLSSFFPRFGPNSADGKHAYESNGKPQFQSPIPEPICPKVDHNGAQSGSHFGIFAPGIATRPQILLVNLRECAYQ
jgi:hypothetical protein